MSCTIYIAIIVNKFVYQIQDIDWYLTHVSPVTSSEVLSIFTYKKSDDVCNVAGETCVNILYLRCEFIFNYYNLFL